jgi:hypothetical protein
MMRTSRQKQREMKKFVAHIRVSATENFSEATRLFCFAVAGNVS